MINETVVGNRVLIARTRAGMNQEQLARHMQARGISISYTTVSKIESGTRTLKFSEAVALCAALSITLEDFWGGEPVPVKPPALSEEDFRDGILASIRALHDLAEQHKPNS